MYPHHQGDNSFTYEFITDFGITYVVEFTDASPYFDSTCIICHKIESVVFSPIGKKGRMDVRIKETICDIIRQRCLLDGVAVVFVCDQSGGLSRDKIFKEWDCEFNGGQFHYQPAEIEHPNGILYTGIIVAKNNPNAMHYLGEFRNSMQVIQVKLN
jgi:hypothetical protein